MNNEYFKVFKDLNSLPDYGGKKKPTRAEEWNQIARHFKNTKNKMRLKMYNDIVLELLHTIFKSFQSCKMPKKIDYQWQKKVIIPKLFQPSATVLNSWLAYSLLIEYTEDKNPQQGLEERPRSKSCDLNTKFMFYLLVT